MNQVLPEIWVNCWKERSKTPQMFADLYAKIQVSDSVQSLGASTEIRDMGVDVLPLIMDKIRGGDAKMVSLVSEIMGHEVGSTPAAVLEWWQANQKNTKLPDTAK